ncbi:MAG TPA: DUF1295 domain-containing protein [Opitutaceae bacterium]|nr:DUF1295 domain-containing protein [Opitutaceae bacterium]
MRSWSRAGWRGGLWSRGWWRSGACGWGPIFCGGGSRLFGEGLADSQLSAFKADPAHRGQVCRAGLWRFSRHPNYFFEWTVWVGYFVLACGSPGGWIGVISPAAMLWLLLRVTGIPMAEQQSLRSKGEAYRQYQRTTSAFVPWFPRHA